MSWKFGVRGHDLVSKGQVEDLSASLKAHGLQRLQLVFPKAFKDHSYENDYVSHVSEVLNEAGIQVAMLGAYFNPVHSDPEVVRKGVANFKANLNIAKYFNHPYVGSETGSYNDSPWTYVPKNHTEEGYQETFGVFSELTRYAEIVGEHITVEPAWGHVIYDIPTLKRFVKDLSSPNVHVTIDLFNLLYEGNFEKRNQIFKEALETFGTEVKIIHLKDAVIENEKMIQKAPLSGDFDYPFMFEQIKRFCPEATLVFEGVTSEFIDASYQGLLKLLEKYN